MRICLNTDGDKSIFIVLKSGAILFVTFNPLKTTCCKNKQPLCRLYIAFMQSLYSLYIAFMSSLYSLYLGFNKAFLTNMIQFNFQSHKFILHNTNSDKTSTLFSALHQTFSKFPWVQSTSYFVHLLSRYSQGKVNVQSGAEVYFHLEFGKILSKVLIPFIYDNLFYLYF